MPSLHAELAAGSSGCKVCGYLNSLTPAEKAEWRAELALSVKVVPHLTVERALLKRGIEVSEASVRRHRRNHATR